MIIKIDLVEAKYILILHASAGRGRRMREIYK